MKIILLSILFQITLSISFYDAINKLETLEKYIREYQNDFPKAGSSLTKLITTYIREGEYQV